MAIWMYQKKKVVLNFVKKFNFFLESVAIYEEPQVENTKITSF